MVRVFILDTTILPDPLEVPEMMEGLPTKRKDKILRCKRLQERKQSLGAGIILSEILKPYGKVMNEIYYGENGKPQIDGAYFNLSHSGSKVVCAVSEKEVGIDIQKTGKLHIGFAERYFAKSEKKYLEEMKDSVKKELEVYRIWTLKESYLKMTGEGLQIPLDQIEIIWEAQPKVYRDDQACECYIKEYALKGYKLAVCAKEAEFADTLQCVTYGACSRNRIER